MISCLRTLPVAIGAATGWRRKLLAFVFGICATLTLAPVFIFPLIIPAYGGLFLLIESSANRRRAFIDGWWWGWGFFVSGLYWFGIALMTDPEKFAWALPLAVLVLPGLIAFFPATACYIYKALVRVRHHGARLYFFALIWLLLEYARGHVLSGFPWNLAGYSFGFSGASLQSASLVGAYGLTFVTVLLGACVVSETPRLAMSLWCIFAVAMLWGQLRITNVGEGEESGAVIRVVQANIAAPHKWDPVLQRAGLEEHIKLSKSPGLDQVTHIIWPETATPYALRSDSGLSHYMARILSEKQTLITGALRAAGGPESYDMFNSLLAIDHKGDIVGYYDKRKLVPFGEFLPLRFLIPQSWELPVGNRDFSQGADVQTLHWKGTPPLSALICYEAIFPRFAADKHDRPEWLLTVTNDAWFGKSSGPYQHFEMARMRAVEQGLPLVRVANTGISAYIDEFGRINNRLDIGEQGVMDFKLRKSQLHDTTYTIYDCKFMLLLIFVGLIFLFRERRANEN